MASSDLEKNMLLKRKLLNKNFGLFKSIVSRYMQLRYFSKVVKQFLALIESSVENTQRKRLSKEVFEYLCRTTDVWVSYTSFKNIVKKKLMNFLKTTKILKNI